MVQRILEPGEIETLAQRSIPRVRLPDYDALFASRAARLHALAPANAIGGYLQFLAVIAEAQHRVLATFEVTLPDAAGIAQAATYRMPPVPAAGWKRDARWIDALHDLASDVAAAAAMPAAVGAICARIRNAPREEIETMADALLAGDAIDIASAPIVMAALQVHWVALTKAFKAESVAALDVPGVCPLCGMLPVASIVRAQSGYRYLHCALCATEWHMVRVHCSSCGADGKQVAYHALQAADATDASTAVQDAAVRAEACENCHSYRKILYQEKDIEVDAVADDVATLALDMLLATQGFHRASGNPLFWQAAQDG